MYPVLCIDAGHGGLGGPDPDNRTGCIAGGIIEKDYTLQIAELLHKSLLSWPVHATMTRNMDETMGLVERGTVATFYGAGLVLSLHVNAHRVFGINGLMCFHQPENDIGREVSEAIVRCSPEPLRRKRAVWVAQDDPYDQSDDWLARPAHVLDPHSGSAVLVELGFATNPANAKALQQTGTKCALVAACLAGVARWLEMIDNAY